MSSPSKTVVTRFAPSPTGFLHIGGARTALFNWLYAKRHGGVFQLRIEDTDRARSTQAAVDAILDGMRWMGLTWDGEVVYQFSRAARHAEAAHALLAQGLAYKCFATPEDLDAMRAEQKAAGKPMRYDGRWRDRDPAEAPAGAPFVVRLKAPQEGATTVEDLVQGPVTVANDQLDDMVLLRADGTPTYMLAVVVDDHDMGVTHVIRGDDHLTNTFRQTQLYRALGWDTPQFGHIPLIHGADGAKLSKRHGALGVDSYRDLGYLPEALRNYLLRLGWSHGDQEIISTEEAIRWFDVDAVGRSPSRFDFTKLASVNQHYIKEADDARLVDEIAERLAPELGAPVSDLARARIGHVVGALKPRAKTLVEMAASAKFLALSRPLPIDDKAAKMLEKTRPLLAEIRPQLDALADWTAAALEGFARETAEAKAIKLGDVAQPLRAALAGSTVSPPIFEVMEALGKAESLGRIDDVLVG